MHYTQFWDRSAQSSGHGSVTPGGRQENQHWVQSKSWWTPRLWVNKSIESGNLSWQYLCMLKPFSTTVISAAYLWCLQAFRPVRQSSIEMKLIFNVFSSCMKVPPPPHTHTHVHIYRRVNWAVLIQNDFRQYKNLMHSFAMSPIICVWSCHFLHMMDDRLQWQVKMIGCHCQPVNHGMLYTKAKFLMYGWFLLL